MATATESMAMDTIRKRNQEVERLNDEIDELIKQRDHWEAKATELAEDVGQLLGFDVGEHSNCNCPVTTAIEGVYIHSQRRQGKILLEIGQECERQIDKWGLQDHPMLEPELLDRDIALTYSHYEIPSEERAKDLINSAVSAGRCTYFHILLEEVCEVAGCKEDQKSMRKELIQVGAVAASMVDCIDRNRRAEYVGFDPAEYVI